MWARPAWVSCQDIRAQLLQRLLSLPETRLCDPGARYFAPLVTSSAPLITGADGTSQHEPLSTRETEACPLIAAQLQRRKDTPLLPPCMVQPTGKTVLNLLEQGHCRENFEVFAGISCENGPRPREHSRLGTSSPLRGWHCSSLQSRDFC